MGDSKAVETALSRFRESKRVSPAFGLDHIQAALRAFDNPQNRIPRAIHITGTNGKGSTGAFIRAAAEASGLKVHVFTSPHLIRVNERIRVAGRLVEDDVLAETLNEVADRTHDLTYFEALTTAAYLLFSRVPADLSIIEVGAGGLLDATNVMDRPAVTVVTPISHDHEAMFGVSGIAAIARLKAGIFRSGVPAIISEQTPIALGVLTEEARSAGAVAICSGRQWRSGWDGEAFVYVSDRLTVRAPWLALTGRRQCENAGAAVAALEALNDDRLTPDSISEGLRSAVWPARLQKLGDGPVTANQPGGVWVDAAHNPAGALMLAEAITAARPKGEKDRVALIVAAQETKDVGGMLAALRDVVDDLVACRLPDSGGQEGGPGADPDHIASVARALGFHVLTARDVLDAIRTARAARADRIYVAGSIYLAGAVLRANGERVD